MTELQQALFDLLKSECGPELSADSLIASIKLLNAAELRHNIRVFRSAEA